MPQVLNFLEFNYFHLNYLVFLNLRPQAASLNAILCNGLISRVNKKTANLRFLIWLKLSALIYQLNETGASA
jgi:hypothetical protein